VLEQLDGARERMATRRFVDRISGKPIGEVTISVGLTDVFKHGDMGHALRAADEALYKAKESGRNRVEIG
jgi:diguanylate cyclase